MLSFLRQIKTVKIFFSLSLCLSADASTRVLSYITFICLPVILKYEYLSLEFYDVGDELHCFLVLLKIGGDILVHSCESRCKLK